MSVHQIAEAIVKLSPQEQEELDLEVRARKLVNDPAFRARVNAAGERMKKEGGVSAEQVRELLAARGIR